MKLPPGADSATEAATATGGVSGGNWVWAALSSRESLTWALLLGASAVALALTVRVVWRIGRAAVAATKEAGGHRAGTVWRRAGEGRGAGGGEQGGTVMLEFALVLPFAMFFILMIAQVMLLMVGNLFVHYAAFAATRAAVVQIGADYSHRGGEPRNEILISETSPKYQAIHEAAAIALWPLGGEMSGGPRLGGQDVGAMLPQVYAAFGREVPGWARNVLPQRLPYALSYTRVTLMAAQTEEGSVLLYAIPAQHEFGPREAVTVRVDHALHLSIPWVRAFFNQSGPDGGVQMPWPSAPATHVSARSTLINEGISTEMPPRPELDRAPTD